MKPIFSKNFLPLLGLLASLIFLNNCTGYHSKYTRGVGIYPGDPAAYTGPKPAKDKRTHRNLARFHTAWHSSSWDYNLTAQLVTDGITTTRMPLWISVLANDTPLPKNEREWLLDQNSVTTVSRDTGVLWIELAMSESDLVPEVTAVGIHAEMNYMPHTAGPWEVSCQASVDGKQWVTLGRESGKDLPGIEKPNPWARFLAAMNNRRNQPRRWSNPFASFYGAPGDSALPQPSFHFTFSPPQPARTVNTTYTLNKPEKYRYYRFGLRSRAAATWTVSDLLFFNQGKEISVVPSQYFTSAWRSANTDTAWVKTDLGARATIDTIKLYWINKAVNGEVQVSSDNRQWENVSPLPGTSDLLDIIPLLHPVKARYVRILMTRPAGGRNYILSELEVMGSGGTLPVPQPVPRSRDQKMVLSGGNWKICRAAENMTGAEISQPGFDDHNWLPATVPGTALVSYLNAGALPDPDFSDNQLMISESYFNADFWYRDRFVIPESFVGKRVFLNFDGINWKADVFLNGEDIGKINGAFIRGIFDITDKVKPGTGNVLAVRIHKNDHIGVVKEQTALSPDKNGGILGADNPTFHASIGWDWIPTIRGRNIGIWNDVYLSSTGPVTLKDPLVTTDLDLPDTTHATVTLQTTLVNHSGKEVRGTLHGQFGDITFQKEITVAPHASRIMVLDTADFPALSLTHPALWWPNGYGPRHLYRVSLAFTPTGGTLSDQTTFTTGIRKMTYDDSNGVLKIYINGRRFVGRGGNWGFPESNLRYRSREYDIAVAYHADMHFTMIRNWVGQTGDDAFYEACDRHGIMVWQDFWLANPADGPDPYDPGMFLDNAADMIKRIRNHPSIAIYVGRNEGNPPQVLDTALRALVDTLSPGITYIPNSAMGTVSGGGPYRALPVKDYFLLYGFGKLHSERGMPNVMNFESLQQTLPEGALWPQNSLWGLHDYCLEGAQGAASFNAMVEKGFGKTDNAREFCERAQWINYNGYRGMFEGRSPLRKGLLLWMSHPAWPSMVWQTYDYYFDPTAAYFGCKKACEPLHIQWNPVWDSVEVVNYSAGNQTRLRATAQIIDMDGTVRWEKSGELDCREDTTLALFKLNFGVAQTPVHFIRLTLTRDGKICSENFYWHSTEPGNWQALNNLPQVSPVWNTRRVRKGDTWKLTTTLKNNSSTPALMIRLKVVGARSHKRILPVFFNDNYVSLMPGEEKTITMTLREADTRGEKPRVTLSGFNITL